MNMEHLIRIAFWIVTLSGCLEAKSLPISEFDVEFVQRHVKCPSDSKFYAPSNIKEECISAALDCFLTELGTVREECEDLNEEINRTAEILEDAKKQSGNVNGNAMENSRECACESWSPAPFAKFLSKMESLFQLQNVAASS